MLPMNFDTEKLKAFGGVLKKNKEQKDIVAFGSCTINQNTLNFLSSLDSLSGILFYYCSFDKIDFSILKNNNIEQITVLHGNCKNLDINQFINITSLKKLKLHDTKITENEINNFLSKSHHITLSF